MLLFCGAITVSSEDWILQYWSLNVSTSPLTIGLHHEALFKANKTPGWVKVQCFRTEDHDLKVLSVNHRPKDAYHYAI